MGDELLEQMLQVWLAEDKKVIKALSVDGFYKALDVQARSRCQPNANNSGLSQRSVWCDNCQRMSLRTRRDRTRSGEQACRLRHNERPLARARGALVPTVGLVCSVFCACAPRGATPARQGPGTPAAPSAVPRVIDWPTGCTMTAAEPGETSVATLCAEALMRIPDWPKDCEEHLNYPDDLYSSFTQEQYIAFYPLLQGRYLMELACTKAAYNPINLYVLYDETTQPPRAEILKFKAWPHACCDCAPSEFPELAEVDRVFGRRFDPIQRQLFTLAKCRGMGDCGDWARYAFPNGRPVLREFWAQTACDGAALGEAYDVAQRPEGWQRYYPQ